VVTQKGSTFFILCRNRRQRKICHAGVEKSLFRQAPRETCQAGIRKDLLCWYQEKLVTLAPIEACLGRRLEKFV
jgi:hypothetical protein